MDKGLSKIQVLFVRAIKSKSSNFRIKRLYQRFYYADQIDFCHILTIFMEINDLLKVPISSKRLINELNPSNAWMYKGYQDEEVSYYDMCCRVIASHIRLTKVSEIPNFVKPLVFRK